MRVPQWVKPAVWGGVVGAAAIMIIGFSWWGWTLGSTAERMARERAEAAVTTALTPLCVANFLAQPGILSFECKRMLMHHRQELCPRVRTDRSQINPGKSIYKLL